MQYCLHPVILTWCIDKLRLKIPWKSKFTDPVIAEVEGLYLIASPLSGIACDLNMSGHGLMNQTLIGCFVFNISN